MEGEEGHCFPRMHLSLFKEDDSRQVTVNQREDHRCSFPNKTNADIPVGGWVGGWGGC